LAPRLRELAVEGQTLLRPPPSAPPDPDAETIWTKTFAGSDLDQALTLLQDTSAEVKKAIADAKKVELVGKLELRSRKK